MKASIRTLRASMKQILNIVQGGEEVIIYSRKNPIAKIIPIKKSLAETQENYGFGMWGDSEETKEVSHYLRKLRKGRQHDI